MNSPIRRLAVVVALLFAPLLVAATYVQYVDAATLRATPGNRRTLLSEYARERGPVLVAGSPVASSVASGDELRYRRRYADGRRYAHATGYYSFVYGAGGGVEGAENALLSGSSDRLFYRRLVDLVTGRDPKGASVELTLDPRAQRAADEALGDQRGAVVALDPRTGAVLALVSHPTYDPGRLAGHDLGAVQRAWRDLTTDPRRPLEDRAVAGRLYPPGSVFKLVTSAAALSSGRYTEDSQLPGPAVLDLPQTTRGLPNDFAGPCDGGTLTLTRALTISCNTAYGYLGLQLGGAALREQARRFGFGQALSVPMRVTPSTVPAQLNAPQTAQSAIGQYDVRVTPLQVAMVAAGIADRGVVMRPYLVRTVRGPDLGVLEQTEPRELSRAVDPSVAASLTRMMRSVVTSGTGTRAQIPGVDVAGKSGTAQQGQGRPPHAWFTAFAPAQDPKVAVAVVVEDGGNAGSEAAGGRVAAPIARRVLEAVLGR